ncbi:hypothetical protein OAU25_03030, partial [Crocinitomicaceae bacterium]|nr:hypothetical protein [Crocinitomicaceae bacterium]
SVDFTNDDENTTNLQTNGDQIISLRGEFGALNSRSDAFTIQSASIDGSMLYVAISYSGGCEEHLFKCIGSRAISKSLPPQRSIQLIHTANNDMCEALIFKNLKIDILPFVEDPKSPIILHLDGYNTPLKFEQI